MNAAVERALVVGAGIGGLTAAAALGQRGIQVDVVDIKAENAVLGVGLSQPGNALRALRSLGVYEEVAAVGFVWDRRVFRNNHGKLRAVVPSLLGGAGVPANIALARPALHRILTRAADRAGAKIVMDCTIADLHNDPDGVDIAFSDGRSDRYDLVVGFDGLRSPLRSRLFGGSYDPVFTGYSVWRITCPRPDTITGITLFQGEHSKAGLCPLSDDEMYLLHVTPEPGNPRYDPADFATMLVARMQDYGAEPAAVRDQIRPDSTIVYSPLEEVLVPSPWHRGRVVIAGDAAHASTPHLTQGAAMAVEDAVVLAECVAGSTSVDEALTDFGRRRIPRARFVHQRSRAILMNEMVHDNAATSDSYERVMRDRMAATDLYLRQPA